MHMDAASDIVRAQKTDSLRKRSGKVCDLLKDKVRQLGDLGEEREGIWRVLNVKTAHTPSISLLVGSMDIEIPIEAARVGLEWKLLKIETEMEDILQRFDPEEPGHDSPSASSRSSVKEVTVTE